MLKKYVNNENLTWTKMKTVTVFGRTQWLPILSAPYIYFQLYISHICNMLLNITLSICMCLMGKRRNQVISWVGSIGSISDKYTLQNILRRILYLCVHSDIVMFWESFSFKNKSIMAN